MLLSDVFWSLRFICTTVYCLRFICTTEISVFFEFGKFYKNLVNLCKFCQNISQIFPDILFKLDIYRNLCNYFNAFISARNHLTVSPGTDHSAGDWPFQIGIMRSVSDLFAHWVNCKCFQYPKSIVLAPQYRIVYPGESFKKSYIYNSGCRMADDVAKRSLDGMFNTNFMFYLPVHNVNLALQYCSFS
jgi:hypothetical protein